MAAEGSVICDIVAGLEAYTGRYIIRAWSGDIDSPISDPPPSNAVASFHQKIHQWSSYRRFSEPGPLTSKGSTITRKMQDRQNFLKSGVCNEIAICSIVVYALKGCIVLRCSYCCDFTEL